MHAQSPSEVYTFVVIEREEKIKKYLITQDKRLLKQLKHLCLLQDIYAWTWQNMKLLSIY
jgi:hypothetical protein